MTIKHRTALSQMTRAALFSLVFSPVALLAQSADPAPAPPTSQDAGPPQHGPRMDPAERDAHMLKMMTRQLNLTPDQVSQIKSIQADSETQMQALHSDTSVQGADRHTKMMDLHKAETDKVRAVLNDEQRTKFDAMQARRRDHMKDGHNGAGGGDVPPPAPPQ